MKRMPLDNGKQEGRLKQHTLTKGKEDKLENGSVEGQFNLHIEV